MRAQSLPPTRVGSRLSKRVDKWPVGTERPKPKLLCGSICMYKQL